VTAPPGLPGPTDPELLERGPGWRAGRVTAAAGAALVLGVLTGVAVWPDEDDPGATPATSQPAPTVSPPTSRAPGAIAVSTHLVDLRGASSGSFGIANIGDLPVLYQVSSRTRWLSVEPIGGQLAGHGGRRIDVRVAPITGLEDRATGSVVVSWDGGTALVRIRHR
jgi:hypothetical protein